MIIRSNDHKGTVENLYSASINSLHTYIVETVDRGTWHGETYVTVINGDLCEVLVAEHMFNDAIETSVCINGDLDQPCSIEQSLWVKEIWALVAQKFSNRDVELSEFSCSLASQLMLA